MSARTEQVYLELRRQLRTGQLEPGDTVTEEKLAAVTGVNRASVRQALARAHAEGPLASRDARGLRVPESSPALHAQLWTVLAGLKATLVTQLLERGLLSSVGDEILVADADELTFHSQLSAALPGEPVSHLHGLVLARMEQLPDT